MTMTPRGRNRVLVVVVACLAISAGVVAGLVAARAGGSSGPGGDGRVEAPPTPQLLPATAPAQRSGLAEMLELSPQQQDEMRAVWEAVRADLRSGFETAESLQRQRDEAMFGLLNEEQKARFEKLSREYADRFAALKKQREERFAQAVQKTRSLLNERQRQKYDGLLKQHVQADGLGAGGAFGLTEPATTTVRPQPATTMPSPPPPPPGS